MATIRSAIQIYDGMTSPLKSINNAMNMVISSFESLQTASSHAVDTASIQAARTELNKADIAFDQIEQSIKQANEAQNKLNNSMKNNGADILLGKIKMIATTMGVAFGIDKIIQLSDSMTSAKARLDLINDGLQSTDDLQNMIMASANRSRSSYQSTAEVVGKLGILTGKAFKSNEEMVGFTELMNKNFVIGGASVQEQTAAMYQLTQAMAAGKLQGDEFRSIMENAPLLAQAIADYMGKPMGAMKELSKNGEITAAVIKGAMFTAADEVNARFAKMPMTFEQVGTVVGNMLLQAFDPVIQGIGHGAQWIYDNWSTLAPIFVGLASAVGIFAVAMGISTAVTWLGEEANRALAIAMLQNPIMWIAMAIGILIGFIYKWVQSVGGIRVAWLIAMDAIQTVTGNVKVAVLTALESMINGAIGLINDFINLLNKIPGVNIGLIGQVSFAAKAAAENEAAKQSRQAAIIAAQNDAAAKAKQQNSGMDWDSLKAGVDNTAANTSKMANKMDMSNEILAYMRDVAEKEAVNKFTTAEVKVDFGGITNHVNSELDLDGIVDYIAVKTTEALETAAEGIH